MISSSFLTHFELALAKEFGHAFRILRHSAVSGGCINQAHKLETTAGNYFVKFNSRARYPGMFEAEAKGLSLLHNTGALKVPEVILFGEHEAFSYIILEYIEAGKRKSEYWEHAGLQLANLHKNSADYFGLDHDNYIGSLPQSNNKHKDWITFFLEERILAIGEELVKPYLEKLEKHFYKEFPSEAPALIHGDLWSGNMMCADDGLACFYDPAVYYGHREMDLAMTRLFGGFPDEFYQAYNAELPLMSGFKDRMDFYQLYPLLVHARLFGASYEDQVLSILNSYR
ncbi:MAG: ketosamine-3-kinase [Bacteroidetes bacterium]|nr:MAG: ketosamine-3-kinase [Bacteroidota bacterium]